MAKRKTLFEVNATHLFQEQDFRIGIRKLFIGGIAKEKLVQMLKKRLGSYAPAYQEAFSLIVDYSGGNARQALRLLNAYYFRRTQGKNDHAAAIALACHQVGKDLLNIPYGRFPTDIFTVVKHDKYIEGSLLTDPKTATGANGAVYHNWLFIQREPDPATPTQWPTIINPLIDEAIEWEADAPRTPEEEAIRKWAQDHDISPLGLNLPVDENGKPAWDKFWEEIEASSFSDRDALNILGLIEEIGAGLFGVERQDRIIITYRDRKNLEAVRDFLVGEANAYSAFPCEEITLEGGEGREPVVELMTLLADQDPNRIYSLELTGKWSEDQLRDLDHRRDILGNLQMLWWIQQDDLKRYLRFWPQLRQFFRIYRLEDELWRGITMEEIQADIDFIKEMSDEADPEGVRRLSAVLAYFKDTGGVMNDNKRRAIVWDTIERIAFRPNRPARWLGVYAKSLHDLWGMDRRFARFDLNDEFTVSFLNLTVNIKLSLKLNTNSHLLHDSSDCLHLKIHVDPEFDSKASLYRSVDNYPSQQIDKLLRNDICAVLKGMIFHPRCHVHLEDFSRGRI